MVPWPFAASLIAAAPPDVTTGSIASYILGYGVVGVVALVMAWLFWKGWRLISPAREAEIRQAVREEARADLVAQVERLERQHEQDQRDKRESDQQRDEALRFTQTNLIPLLVNFTNATTALLPILQQVVQHQEGGGSLDPRRRSR